MRLCSPILCCLDEQIFYILMESSLYIPILHHISRNNARKIKSLKAKKKKFDFKKKIEDLI